MLFKKKNNNLRDVFVWDAQKYVRKTFNGIKRKI